MCVCTPVPVNACLLADVRPTNMHTDRHGLEAYAYMGSGEWALGCNMYAQEVVVILLHLPQARHIP